MARPGGAKTAKKILAAARERAATTGLASLTLDGIAADVGITKQAVLYHFGSKRGLLLALLSGELEQESVALCETIRGATSAAEAVHAFLTGAVDYYLEDLSRFRLLYVVHQQASHEVVVGERELEDHVYPKTSRFYDALERAISADPQTSADVHARRTAVGVHFAALGIACYIAMLEAAGDTLRHDPRQIAADMAGHISRGLTR